MGCVHCKNRVFFVISQSTYYKQVKTDKIKVGIIGLNPDGQWASTSHLPALRHLSDTFEIIGVANSTHESAVKAANVLQIPIAFEHPAALIASAEIALVVITVKVPYHYDLVKAALEAGKHVYCEHPLGNGLIETEELAAIAERKNVVAAVGTQMVVSPEVIYLEHLIKEGYVGRVLSTTLIGSGGPWSDEALAADYYLYDKSNGATMLTIPLGHTLAGVTKVLGGFDTLTAKMTTNFTTVKLTDSGEIKPKTAEDQIMVIGRLKNGAAIAIHYRGGVSRGTNLLWEINGTEGDIQVTGPLGHGQFAPLTIWAAQGEDRELQALAVPNEMLEGLPNDPVVRNVMQVYKSVAADIRNKTKTAPSFTDAVVLGRLLNDIEQSSGEKRNSVFEP
jgi:predicted dehydrogenase